MYKPLPKKTKNVEKERKNKRVESEREAWGGAVVVTHLSVGLGVRVGAGVEAGGRAVVVTHL